MLGNSRTLLVNFLSTWSFYPQILLANAYSKRPLFYTCLLKTKRINPTSSLSTFLASTSGTLVFIVVMPQDAFNALIFT